MVIHAERHTVCEHCLAEISGTIHTVGTEVFLEKCCVSCGRKRGKAKTQVLISSDLEYYSGSWIGAQTNLNPKGFSALIIEVTDDCNLHCPTCIAGSKPGAGNTKRLSTIQKLIRIAELSPRKPDILMISGGEPTVHSKSLDILQLACASSIPHIFLITNGTRIAEEPSFVASLANLPKKFEVYLQFDSLEPRVLIDLRGEDFSAVRRKAVENLGAYKIPATLICVVKQGLNDHLCGDVVRYALSFPHIKGVTFQPIKASGRTDSLTSRNQIIDLSRVRNRLIEANVGFSTNDLAPHPMNTENICTGYLLRTPSGNTPVTRQLCDRNGKNTPLSNCLYFLPKHDSHEFKYDKLFRVTVVSFMDKYNFMRELLPYSPVGFVTSSATMVPLDTYYLFGRKK